MRLIIISSILFFIFFLCVGSFNNVLIYRIPNNEQFVSGRSHCIKCNHELQWYDNIPLFSFILLKGKCRYCGEPISPRYPIVEAVTSILASIISIYYLCTLDLYSEPYKIIIPFVMGLSVCMMVALSVIDFNTLEIPMGFNIFLFCMGIIITVLTGNYLEHIIGMISVSTFLFLVFFITSGKGLGFGDVKLMFALGLLLGWKSIVIGFFIGCILAIIIHSIRMKVSKESHVLAFGPYLCMGAYIGVFIGEPIINAYISFLNSLT